jgi:hypothetical protein
MRISAWIVFSGCLLLAPSAWAQRVKPRTSVNTTSTSTAQVDTTNTTSVTQQVNTFQTELKARMQGGAYLFDQTYSVAFTDPSIATAVTQAKNVLSGVGAVSFSGPTQLSSNQSTTSVTNTVQTGQTIGTVTSTPTTYIGAIPGGTTLTIGTYGVCTGSTPYPPRTSKPCLPAAPAERLLSLPLFPAGRISTPWSFSR